MFEDESGQSQKKSHDSDHSENESESKNDSPEKIIDQVIDEIEMLEEKRNNGIESYSQKFQHSHNILDQSSSPQTKDLIDEWKEFSEAIKTPKENPYTNQETSFKTPEHSQKIVETVNPLQRVPAMHDKKIISAYPTHQIVLQIEYIPSLDIFYSPSYKVVVKRNKRRRIDETTSKPIDESVDVLWKDSLDDPTEHLTKLSQYARAYATATVNKAIEVRLFLKQKEARVQELEKLLNEEKFNSSEKFKVNTTQFHKDVESLKLQHQTKINEKQAQLEIEMTKLQSQPQLEKFIKDALDLNTKLMKEQEVFFHQASMIDSYSDSSKRMIQQIGIQKLECERLEKKIEKHI